MREKHKSLCIIFQLSLREKAFGLLVLLGFDITAFTPAAYQRGSLPRPYIEISSRGKLRA